MKWLFIAGGIFVLVVLVVLIVGLLQPVKHSVTRSIHLKEKPEVVFALLADSEGLTNWSSTVLRVESLPEREGKRTARYTLKWGGMQMIMTELERTPPNRLVVRMAKEGGTVLGTWTYEVVAEAGGCEVALTEDGELKNSFFRALARMRGMDANITQTLRDLEKKFGENGGK